MASMHRAETFTTKAELSRWVIDPYSRASITKAKIGKNTTTESERLGKRVARSGIANRRDRPSALRCYGDGSLQRAALRNRSQPAGANPIRNTARLPMTIASKNHESFDVP